MVQRSQKGAERWWNLQSGEWSLSINKREWYANEESEWMPRCDK